MTFERPPPLNLTPVPGDYVHDWRKLFPIDGDECRKCGKSAVEYRSWESSDGAFEDTHYRCTACGSDWWVDGPDA